MVFVFLDCNKIHKKQKFSASDMVELWSKEMWLTSYLTYIDHIAQVYLSRPSIFSFFDVMTLKLRNIIICQLNN